MTNKNFDFREGSRKIFHLEGKMFLNFYLGLQILLLLESSDE